METGDMDMSRPDKAELLQNLFRDFGHCSQDKRNRPAFN